MELKEMIKVMQHFADGGEVEVRMKGDDSWIWERCPSPIWAWENLDYRAVKQKVTIERWLCKDLTKDYIIVETSGIDNYDCYEKIKLLETYEVEL